MEYVAIVFKNDNDGFVATVPDIDGCIVYRDTFEEALESVVDAAEICLEDEDLPDAHVL